MDPGLPDVSPTPADAGIPVPIPYPNLANGPMGVQLSWRAALLPRLDEELKHARVSYSQVRAITRVATVENEGRLIDIAKVSTAAQLERIVRGVRQVNAQLEGEAAGSRQLERWVRERPMGDGTVRVEAQLTVDRRRC